MSGRRGGIPGPESRTGLVRPPVMSEAEFERRQAAAPAPALEADGVMIAPEPEPSPPRLAATPNSRDGRGRAGRVQADQAATGPADVRPGGGPRQEALALRHPRRQGPLRRRQRPAPARGRLDGPLRLARPPLRPRRRAGGRGGAGGGVSRAPDSPPFALCSPALCSRKAKSKRQRAKNPGIRPAPCGRRTRPVRHAPGNGRGRGGPIRWMKLMFR